MAAPPEMHLGNLTGKFIMNSRMSASIDDVLAAQGVGYLKRKAIQLATIYLTIDHGKTDTGVERIKIQSSASGLKGADEEYIFDGITRERNHEVYGYIKASSKRMPMQDVSEAYLKEGWIEDEFGKSGGIVYVHSEADMSLNTGDQWTAIQTWGFQMIDVNGKMERRYVRLNQFKCPARNMDKLFKLVYDYNVNTTPKMDLLIQKGNAMKKT